jgi:hypothetical protein
MGRADRGIYRGINLLISGVIADETSVLSRNGIAFCRTRRFRPGLEANHNILFIHPRCAASVAAPSGATRPTPISPPDRPRPGEHDSRSAIKGGEVVKVLVGERLSTGKSVARFRLPGERALIAAIVIAFLILHILAGTILQRATAGGPGASREEVPSSFYD